MFRRSRHGDAGRSGVPAPGDIPLGGRRIPAAIDPDCGTLARGAESVLSNSLYRAGYEVLFTPVSAREKRAVKPLADVGAARVGDLIAAGFAQGVLMLSISRASLVLTAMALAVSALAVVAAFQLHAGYVRTLERMLQSRAIELDLSEVHDAVTQSIMLKTMGALEVSRIAL